MNENIKEIIDILREAYAQEMEKGDFYGKSEEGGVSVKYYYGNVYDKTYGDLDGVTVKVYSYVFGPHRMHEFDGKTLEEASLKALNAVRSWLEMPPKA